MFTMVLDDLLYTGADRRYLYYPGDTEFVVADFNLNLSCEEVSSLEFKMYPKHPYYDPVLDPIEPRRSMITVYRDDTIIFYGQVRDVKLGLDGGKTIYAVDELAFLLDTIQPQFVITGQNNAYVLNTMLQRHNALVSADRQFQFGKVSGPGDPWFQSTYIVQGDYQPTLDIIREQMSTYTVKYNKGGAVEPRVYRQYVKVRRENPSSVSSVKRIDVFNFYESDFVETVNQPIKLRRNILDFTLDRNGEEFYTALIPLGATKDTEDVPGIQGRVNIKSVNNNKNYVQNDYAVRQYGFVCGVVQFDETTSPATLKQLGEKELNKHLTPVQNLEVTAFDLSLAGYNYDAFELGKKVEVFSVTPEGMKTQEVVPESGEMYGIIGLSINPLDPASNTVTLTKGIYSE